MKIADLPKGSEVMTGKDGKVYAVIPAGVIIQQQGREICEGVGSVSKVVELEDVLQ